MRIANQSGRPHETLVLGEGGKQLPVDHIQSISVHLKPDEPISASIGLLVQQVDLKALNVIWQMPDPFGTPGAVVEIASMKLSDGRQLIFQRDGAIELREADGTLVRCTTS